MFWSCWVVWHVVRATSCQISKYWGSSQIFPHYFCERKQIEQLEEARFILQENTAIAPVLPALPQRDGWKHWLSTQLSHSTASFTCFPATLLEQYYFTAFTMVSLSERLHSQVHPAFLTAPQSSGNVCWNQCPHTWWGAGKMPLLSLLRQSGCRHWLICSAAKNINWILHLLLIQRKIFLLL